MIFNWYSELIWEHSTEVENKRRKNDKNECFKGRRKNKLISNKIK